MSADPRSAVDYIATIFKTLEQSYGRDCVTHACRIAVLLRREQRAPWIGRIRETRAYNETTFHGPLIPRRLRGADARAWTTHYVACSARDVYDPLHGESIDLDAFTLAVFGKSLRVETYLDVDETERLLASGELHSRFTPATISTT